MEAGVTERIAAALLLPRQALHARWLRFQVPGSAGEAVEVTAPLPEDLATFLAGLGWGEAPG
jgi:hypothetical protein